MTEMPPFLLPDFYRSRRSRVHWRAALMMASLLVFAFSGTAGAEIWAIKSCGTTPGLCPSQSNPSEPPTHLFRFAENGTAFTSVGPVERGGQSIDADGLAITASGQLYAFELLQSVPPPASASQLLAIDPLSGNGTAIGTPLAGREIRAATFDRQGRLWVADALADELFRVDPSSGAVVGSPIGMTESGQPLDLSNSIDLAAMSTGEMLLVSGRRVLRVDTSSGVVSELHDETTNDDEAGQPPFFVGLAPGTENPDALFAFDVTFEDDVFRYDDSGFVPMEVYSDVYPIFNSGRGDLASSLPPPTVPFSSRGATWILIAATTCLGAIRLRSCARPV